jgi:glycine cleavage system pyridoxal-binding protein P
MPFIPHTDDDIRDMLAAIGAGAIDELFDEIPAGLRVAGLPGIPPGMSEMEVSRLMQARAESGGRPLCFLGAGAYDHHIPAAVWEITTRGEFYSAYTPYQAEASQGTLQLIYEYQTMMASLNGMDVSNASLYDGALRGRAASWYPRRCIPATAGPPAPLCATRASSWSNFPMTGKRVIRRSTPSPPARGRISPPW